ncbi:MFS transporter [Tenggerimyces flavus]|uniref:MFS transporter n=1 Tax=Tenggerimyces flavus TaxID=1708749 RepID=A0ABV7Y9W0_9ACTN|nr:MFS transporter [Tenggerimyces flavus]MBM7785588.1 EmrB/QacA subfamily drug resistance transporter [Tenggerimyces flavus]
MSTDLATRTTSRWLALVALCAGQLMIILDGTIVTVAGPSIQADLGFTQANLAWIVNAYLIAFGGLLLLSGRLGDLAGRKRIFTAGLVIFTIASLAAGLADHQGVLIAARFVQGVGGAMTTAVALGMIITMFPEPLARAKALGVYAFVGSAGASIGVFAGGVLTQTLGWNWVFYVNLPIGIAIIALASRVLRNENGLGFQAGADVVGSILVTAGLMLGVYTIVQPTFWFGAVSVALLGAFVVRQARARNPLLPLRIFRNRTLTAANISQMLMIAAMMGFQFVVALYLQRVLGYDALATGLAFLPITFAIGIVSLGLSARLVTRFGPRRVLIAGQLFLAVGFVILMQATENSGYVFPVLPALIVLGVGGGLSLPSINSLTMSDVAPDDAGLASGLANTTMQVGGALGVAVLAALATSRADHLTSVGERATAALASGYQLAFTVSGTLILAAALVAFTLTKKQAA